MGSFLGVVDPATGTAAARYDYAAFGQRTATGALGQRYGFTGREEDAESSLLYFRARHYDPATGTFLQRDPIGFASGDLNLYAYVWNNPTRWSDPGGLSSVDYAGTAGRASAGGTFGAGVGTIGRGVWALAQDIARKVALNSAKEIVRQAANEGSGGASGAGPDPDDDGGDDNESPNPRTSKTAEDRDLSRIAEQDGFDPDRFHDWKDFQGYDSKWNI